MLSSSNKKNDSENLVQKGFSSEAQRKKNQGLVSFRESKKKPWTGMKFTEKAKVAAVKAAEIPEETGYDSDFDVEVVHCKLRGDECSTTDTGDFSSESEDGFGTDSSFSANEGVSSDDENDDCSTLDGHTDTEDEGDEDDDDDEDEVVNVANWHGVAVGMAAVFKAADIEDFAEDDFAEDEEEEEREPIDVRNWENVGTRMALVFQEAAEEDWV